MKLMTILSLVLITSQAFAQSPTKIKPRVVYGTDDRMDIYESDDNLMKELSLSTAAQIHNSNVNQRDFLLNRWPQNVLVS